MSSDQTLRDVKESLSYRRGVTVSVSAISYFERGFRYSLKPSAITAYIDILGHTLESLWPGVDTLEDTKQSLRIDTDEEMLKMLRSPQ